MFASLALRTRNRALAVAGGSATGVLFVLTATQSSPLAALVVVGGLALCAIVMLFPWLAVLLTTKDGFRATAGVPSGASTGTREAVELRDGDATRFGGAGVAKPLRVLYVNPFSREVSGPEEADYREPLLVLMGKRCLRRNA